jgi:hypothetical protein
MPDIVLPLPASGVPHHIEVRADQVILTNGLDASGAPGTPGKYRVVIDTQAEVQDANNQTINRTRRPAVSFDPMDHAATEIPGTGRTLGAIMMDLLAAVDFFKGGKPPAAS